MDSFGEHFLDDEHKNNYEQWRSYTWRKKLNRDIEDPGADFGVFSDEASDHLIDSMIRYLQGKTDIITEEMEVEAVKRTASEYKKDQEKHTDYTMFSAPIYCECGNFMGDVYVFENKEDCEKILKPYSQDRLMHVYQGSKAGAGGCMKCGLPNGVKPKGSLMTIKRNVFDLALSGADGKTMRIDVGGEYKSLKGRYTALSVNPMDTASIYSFFHYIDLNSVKEDPEARDALWKILIASYEDLAVRDSAMRRAVRDINAVIEESDWPLNEQLENSVGRVLKNLEKETLFSTTDLVAALREKGIDGNIVEQVLESLD